MLLWFHYFYSYFPFPSSPFITSSVYIVYSWQLFSLSPLQVWDRRALREDNPKPVGVLAGGEDGYRFALLVIFCPQIWKQRLIPQTEKLYSLKMSRSRWRNCLLGPTRGWAPPNQQQQGPDDQTLGYQVHIVLPWCDHPCNHSSALFMNRKLLWTSFQEVLIKLSNQARQTRSFKTTMGLQMGEVKHLFNQN